VSAPRILLATPDFPPMSGGIQQLLAQLVRHAGWETTVTCFADDGCETVDAAIPADVLRTARARDHRASVVRLGVATTREIRRRHPDLVLSGHLVLGPAVLAATRRPRRPSAQLVYAKELGTRPRVAREVLSRIDATITISDYSRELAIAAGAPPQRVQLVLPGGGIETPAPARTAAAEPTVVTVARLEDRYKGFDVVMRAMPLVRARVADARWLVVGDGSLRPQLQATAQRWGMSGYVSFLGAVDDQTRDDVLRRASVFVMTSRVPAGHAAGEGFGIVYLEAGAAGLPVVAADEGGATSAVLDGVTGLLCDPRDHVAVADRIVRLLCDPQLAQRLGEAGRARQRALSWERMAREVDAIVRALIAR
jgi:phosphatidylinositol alpha-1,6-mannosyltransferase